MSVWQIIRRELRQMFITDRRRATFLFGASLIYLILFGLLYAPHVIKQVPLVIYDEDQSSFSRALTEHFADSERFRIVQMVSSEEQMTALLQTKEAYAAVHIPQKFSQEAKSGRASSALLIVDGSNILITNTVTTAAQEIISYFSKQTASALTEKAGMMPAIAQNRVGPVDLVFRVLHNPTLSYQAFFVIGLAMAALQQGIFLSMGASITQEVHPPDEWRYVSPIKVMTGKLLPYLFSSLIAFVMTTAVAVQAFAIPLKGSILSLLLFAAVFIFTAASFSALVASFCSSEATFSRLSIIYTVPAFVLSGYTWPLEAMDSLSRFLSSLFPYSYFANTVREIMIAGYSPSFYHNLVILLLLGLLFFGAATQTFGRKIKRLSASPKKKPFSTEGTDCI